MLRPLHGVVLPSRNPWAYYYNPNALPFLRPQQQAYYYTFYALPFLRPPLVSPYFYVPKTQSECSSMESEGIRCKPFRAASVARGQRRIHPPLPYTARLHRRPCRNPLSTCRTTTRVRTSVSSTHDLPSGLPQSAWPHRARCPVPIDWPQLVPCAEGGLQTRPLS